MKINQKMYVIEDKRKRFSMSESRMKIIGKELKRHMSRSTLEPFWTVMRRANYPKGGRDADLIKLAVIKTKGVEIRIKSGKLLVKKSSD